MSNSAARLISLSIVILTCGILLSVASIAQAMNPNRGQEASAIGMIALLIGAVLYVVEFVSSTRPRD
jgi:hypothetical protein